MPETYIYDTLVVSDMGKFDFKEPGHKDTIEEIDCEIPHPVDTSGPAVHQKLLLTKSPDGVYNICSPSHPPVFFSGPDREHLIELGKDGLQTCAIIHPGKFFPKSTVELLNETALKYIKKHGLKISSDKKQSLLGRHMNADGTEIKSKYIQSAIHALLCGTPKYTIHY